MRKILVTSALPYANGPIHIGHLVEYIQTDVWVRFQKLMGHTCHYMCADDAHGTPIMLSAKKNNMTPEAMIAAVHDAHRRDFESFGISFDHYYSTHSPENEKLASDVYLKAKEKGLITQKEIEQYYCEKDGLFLPDRLIRGTCPKCHAADQYGDACEKCAATYDPTQLLSPTCSHCGETPVIRPSIHYFFKLSQLQTEIQSWLKKGPLNTAPVRAEVANKLQEWFVSGIKDWDISRDAPYFGFQIPDTDKYFYVWMDAPIGYIATTQHWASQQQTPDLWKEIWSENTYEIHHVIGKDILYFHTLFWPALLIAGDFQLPSQVHVHGFLTVNGEKMSKSRGTFITAAQFSESLNPEYLRYYLMSKCNGGMDDIDLNLEDFVTKINAEVVNKVVNIGSRLGSIVTKKRNGILTTPNENGHKLLSEIRNKATEIADHYDSMNYLKATREIMALADQLNVYIDNAAPWSLVSSNPAEADAVCCTGLNGLRYLSVYLAPLMPKLTQGFSDFLQVPFPVWSDLNSLLTDHPIATYQHLAQRLDLAVVTKALAHEQ
jgi:methionyl-tRNA synthetase